MFGCKPNIQPTQASIDPSTHVTTGMWLDEYRVSRALFRQRRKQIRETRSKRDVVLLLRHLRPSSAATTIEDHVDALEIVLQFVKTHIPRQRFECLQFALLSAIVTVFILKAYRRLRIVIATKEMMNLPSTVSSLWERTTDMSAVLLPALNVFSIKSLFMA